jgi:AhpD family alkylhydroperoxidase
MTFTIHTTDSAPQGSADALAALERNIGFVPNLAATIAGSPAAMNGFVGMQSALRTTTLSALEREVIGITVSRANTCPYSIAAHSAFAARAGAAPEVLEALRTGEPLPDERLEALRAFTLAVLESSGHASAGTLPPETALEALAQIAYTTMANLVANVAETPVDEAFRETAVP